MPSGRGGGWPGEMVPGRRRPMAGGEMRRGSVGEGWVTAEREEGKRKRRGQKKEKKKRKKKKKMKENERK